jgi:hypothetical protein
MSQVSIPPSNQPPPTPPFTPRASKRLLRRHKSSSPTRPVTIANGCNLLVRGVGSDERGSNPVSVVELSIATLMKGAPDLRAIPVLVKPFKHGASEWLTSCYVHVDTMTLGRSAEPRADLLEKWKDVLTIANPEWEVAWTPSKHGSDKRMWVRFLDLPSLPGDNDKFSKVSNVIVKWANATRFTITSSYVFKGALIATLASPIKVDALVLQEKVSIPGLPAALKVTQGNQIEVLNAFEMAVTGLSDDYEGLDASIEIWLDENFSEDGQPTLVDSRRDPYVPNCVIFHMTTWAAMAKVLDESTADKFKDAFGSFGNPSPPQLLTKLNADGIYRKPGLRLDFARGETTLNTALKSFEKRMQSLEESTNKHFDASDRKIDNVNKVIGHLEQSIVSLNQNLAYTKTSILAQASITDLDRAILELHSQQNQIKLLILMERTDDVRKAQQAQLDDLMKQEKFILEKQKDARTNFSLIMTNQPSSLPLSVPSALIAAVPAQASDVSQPESGPSRKRPRPNKDDVPRSILMSSWNDEEPWTDVAVCPNFNPSPSTLKATNGIRLDILNADTVKSAWPNGPFYGVFNTLKDFSNGYRSCSRPPPFS